MRNARFYGILDLGYVTAGEAPVMAQRMIAGGVEILQLRAKGWPAADIPPLARSIAPICRAHGVPFLLNDHPALVRVCEADGVHVGQDDMAVAEARAAAGPGAIVGKSTHSLDQAVAAQAEGPDYIGFGPLFATPTKPDYTPIGLDDIAETHRRVQLPIFCIGGIKLGNLPSVLGHGARRVVIVSGILQAADPESYCREVCGLLEKITPAN